jgi:hypothetical protein
MYSRYCDTESRACVILEGHVNYLSLVRDSSNWIQVIQARSDFL